MYTIQGTLASSDELIKEIRYLAEKEGSFRKLLNLARLDSLPDRESRIFAFRYGLTDGEVHTLAKTGRHFGISRERSRQILLRAHHRITSESMRQLKSGSTDQPCVRLALFVQRYVSPQSGDSAQRLATLLMQEFRDFCPSTDIVKFIASLAYRSLESVGDHIVSALRIVHERHSGCIKHEMALIRIRKLLSYVYWPPTSKKLTDEEMFDIRRQVEEPPTTGLDSYYSLKMGRFVKFSSRLELDFYRLLEHADEVVQYDAHPLAVSHGAKGQGLTYYPDLLVLLGDSSGIVVEIVPLFRMALWRNLIKFDALKRYCDRVGFGLLVTDGYNCLEQVHQYKVNEEYASEVMRCVSKNGTVDWNAYRQIKHRYHPKKNDFVGLIVQNRLAFYLSPFKITTPMA